MFLSVCTTDTKVYFSVLSLEVMFIFFSDVLAFKQNLEKKAALKWTFSLADVGTVRTLKDEVMASKRWEFMILIIKAPESYFDLAAASQSVSFTLLYFGVYPHPSGISPQCLPVFRLSHVLWDRPAPLVWNLQHAEVETELKYFVQVKVYNSNVK